MHGGFELVRRIASGKTGEVFVARKVGSEAFEKLVALKLLLPHLAASEEAVARFYSGARFSARMNHPNIVQVFDVGTVEGRPFMAMQYVEGFSLKRYIELMRDARRLPPMPVVAAVAQALLDALQYVHELRDWSGAPLKPIHHAVTPSNVLLSHAGVVQLVDFGMARIASDDVGRVAEGRQEDLLSAALTLHELMTLESPPRMSSQRLALEALRVDLTQWGLARGEALEAKRALLRAFSLVPGERFETALAFRKAFVGESVATAVDMGEHLRSLTTELASEPPTVPEATKTHLIRITSLLSAHQVVQQPKSASALAETVRWREEPSDATVRESVDAPASTARRASSDEPWRAIVSRLAWVALVLAGLAALLIGAMRTARGASPRARLIFRGPQSGFQVKIDGRSPSGQFIGQDTQTFAVEAGDHRVVVSSGGRLLHDGVVQLGPRATVMVTVNEDGGAVTVETPPRP